MPSRRRTGARAVATAVTVTVTASAALATLVVIALGRGRLRLLCRRRGRRLGLLRGWWGAAIAVAIRAASTAFGIALLAALAAFAVVAWGVRFYTRSLCNLEGFTWKRLPMGHCREGNSTEGGE